RLPSEAEWEYACRAGTQTRYYFGDNENQLGDYAWYGDNSGDSILNTAEIWENNQEGYFDRLMNNKNKTHPVGQKQPNPWGLYDMHGNVWEWCEDQWHDNYQKAPTDGSPWNDNDSQERVVRGGSWLYFPWICRSASRHYNNPVSRDYDVGFRVLCESPRLS
ncbi:MAG: formylglycine-generating enzyme family protein, partial [Cyanobacteriota bacterium]